MKVNPRSCRGCAAKYETLKTGSNSTLVKYYKPIICSLDSIISTVIVTPLVVGMWRALWTLMDVYKRLFPPWETFLFGMMVHLGFAMISQVLQEKIGSFERSFLGNAATFVGLRLFTYFFAVINTLHWRGGWMLMDDLLGITSTPDDVAVVPEDNFWTVCGIILALVVATCILRCFKNVMSPPFVVVMDWKENAFDFPTRFRVKVAYSAYYISLYDRNEAIDQQQQQAEESSSETRAERLTSEITQPIDLGEAKELPRPFQSEILGPAPKQFAMATKRAKTQANPSPYDLPRSIQDIIDVMAFEAKNSMLPEDGRQSRSRPRFLRGNATFRSVFERNADPFRRFKPQDPGDVNLMSTHGFRFAPPVWADVGKKAKKTELALDDGEETKGGAVGFGARKNALKPILVTFSIYPSDKGQGVQKIAYGPQTQNLMRQGYPKRPFLRLESNPGPPTPGIVQYLRANDGGRSGKMFIRLRKMPEFESAEESRKITKTLGN